MLDNVTKKNIDDCRDVLVGKVPDPKSQIEQITIALIYKFMDDMDKEAVEKFKGKPKFFAPPKKTGDPKVDKKLIDYSKYGWRKLFDPKLGGKEMLELYSEALDKLQTNPNIPELFRNIFKNAYLPYRDPSTLKLFLKYINEFEYSHSEKLGDAFEYLLSVMGSQGDAGQFRTPRHIIDFVTACVNPQKNETVLDPACGTAGFLLSAYKHILKQNTEKRQGDKLTPDQRKKLATNFVGYDISPDMVRLSLANMYLHGFATPQIHEYDSLSSEDRWNETFDVILANPPFMTPKGGIRPHKKFGVQANKAEVLFTDYIAEHLNSNGRAGIVVPNGIVATSQTAYKQLRKMLVKDCLIAVISLPAGCFNPYSGVKTSVLILDKRLAKKSQHILFLKIDNDGFDLGAQRGEIDKNDLPLALQTLQSYKECLSNDKDTEELPSLATLVLKEVVLANNDVVLNVDRYSEKSVAQTEFELVKLAEVCEFKRGPFGGSLKKEIFVSDGYLVYEQYHAINDDFNYGRYFINEDKFQEMIGFEVRPFDLLISCSGTMGRIAIVPENAKRGIINQALLKLTLNQSKILPLYLKKILETEGIQERYFRNQEGAAIQNVASVKVLKEIEIPLPPLEIQRQIVAEIEGYQKIIDGAKQVVDNYKPTIPIKREWEMVELGEVGKICMCKRVFKEQTADKGDVPFYKIGTFGSEPDAFISQEIFDEYKSKFAYPKKGDVLISTSGTIGKIVVFDGKPAYFQDSNIVWIANDESKVTNEYLKVAFQQIKWKPTEGVTIARLYNGIIEETKIPLPPMQEQQSIVKAIEEEMQLVSANKRIIEIFEQKIKTKISEVWGVKTSAYQLENEKLSMAAESNVNY